MGTTIESKNTVDQIALSKIRYFFNEILCWSARKVQFRMHPHRNLFLRGELWRATGSDSAFLLAPKMKLMPQGWYMLSLQLDADIPILNVKLYPDYGSGFQEEQTFSLPVRNRHLTKRLCHFPSMPKRMRLNPNDTSCTFQIKYLCLSKVTESFAIDRMKKKVFGNKNPQLVDQTKKDPASLKLLLQRYDKVFTKQTAGPSYREWIEKNEHKHDAGLELPEFSYKPLISIVVPVWNTPAGLLRKCIESVQRQTYQNWQLCLADDASTVSHVKEILAGYVNSDRRIESVFREENGHICRASNSALEIAKGEFLAFLDHDDELAPTALMEIIKALRTNPDALIIYSDEDKIDEYGSRFDPVFKPDWNRDLLYSANYISHLGVYRTALVREIGGFRPGLEGSQDYDLLLRCVARVTDAQIVHIAKILYHWRAIEGSTAMDPDSKSYTESAGVRALVDHFRELRQEVQVTTGTLPNTYKVRWPIPSPPPLVSLLIPTRDKYQLLKQCIDSILIKTTYEHYEILVLDNRTTCEATLEYLEELKRHEKIRVLKYDKPFNFSAVNNFGVTRAAGEIIGLINNDIEVIAEDWLSEMVSHAVRPDIGCVGAKLYYYNNTIQHAGVVLGIGGVANHAHLNFERNHGGYFGRLKVIQNYSAVTAACLLVRKNLYERVGGLNEDDLAIAFNDIDFCLKVRRAGYRNLWTPYAELYHHESISRGAEDTPEKQARFTNEVNYMLGTWFAEIANDPCYNPNLTKSRGDFSLS